MLSLHVEIELVLEVLGVLKLKSEVGSDEGVTLNGTTERQSYTQLVLERGRNSNVE